MKSLYIVQRILKYNKKQSLYLLLFRVTFIIDPALLSHYMVIVYIPPYGGSERVDKTPRPEMSDISKIFCSQRSRMMPIFFHRFLCNIFLCVFSRRKKWISYSIMDMSLISG